jgi:DNA-binding response OmpR family regulator
MLFEIIVGIQIRIAKKTEMSPMNNKSINGRIGDGISPSRDIAGLDFERGIAAILDLEGNAEALKFFKASSKKFGFEILTLKNQSISSYIQTANYNDCLIIYSANYLNALNLIRRYSAELNGIPKIALTSGAQAIQRANLFHAGYDGVFEIENDTLDLVSQAIIAFRRRYQFSKSKLMKHPGITDQIASLAYIEQISRRQATILHSLATSPDRSVDTKDLCHLCGSKDGPISHNHLKVLITSLRKSLRPGIKISSLSRLEQDRSGYQLVICEDF